MCVNTTLKALKTHTSKQKIHYCCKFMDDNDDDRKKTVQFMEDGI